MNHPFLRSSDSCYTIGMFVSNPSMQQSMVLFLLLATGFAAGKMGVLKTEVIRSLSRFLVDFSLPALIVMSMQKPFSADLRDQAFRILFISLVFYLSALPLAYGLTWFYKKAKPGERGIHRFSMCFANVAFMGFPVAEAILGRESLFMVSIYNIPFQFLAFSIGIFMVAGPDRINPSGRSRTENLVSMILNPAIISTIIGFLLFMFSVNIPSPFSLAATMLGSITTPLSMVLIGSVLSGTRIRTMVGNPRVWTTSLYRLLLHPLLVLIAVKFAGLSGMELYVPVLMAGMPVAANASILAGVYGGDTELSSSLVFITTLASLASIPLLYRLLT